MNTTNNIFKSLLTKSISVFAVLLTLQSCQISKSTEANEKLPTGKTIANYLKTVQYSKNGKHLFGHESTIMMGVSGEVDWELKTKKEIENNLSSQKSDVKEMTGQLPAIMDMMLSS